MDMSQGVCSLYILTSFDREFHGITFRYGQLIFTDHFTARSGRER